LPNREHCYRATSDSALAYRDPELGPDHVYAGLLTCMFRLVFVLYPEDNDLLPVDDDFYAEHLSALTLYEDLAADASAYLGAMARRFGAYGHILPRVKEPSMWGRRSACASVEAISGAEERAPGQAGANSRPQAASAAPDRHRASEALPRVAPVAASGGRASARGRWAPSRASRQLG